MFNPSPSFDLSGHFNGQYFKNRTLDAQQDTFGTITLGSSSASSESNGIIPMELLSRNFYGIRLNEEDKRLSSLDKGDVWPPSGPLKEHGDHVEIHDIIPPSNKRRLFCSSRRTPPYVPLNLQSDYENDSFNIFENTLTQRALQPTTPVVPPATLVQPPKALPPYLKIFRTGVHIPKFDDFQKVLDLIGSSGIFHYRSLYGFILTATFLHSMFTLDIFYLLFTQPHWCASPTYGRNQDFPSYLKWRNDNVPMININITNLTKTYDPCNMYDEKRTVVDCEFGWAFDDAEYKQTIPSDYEYVCEDKDVPDYAISLYTTARIIGAFVSGQVADIIGRRGTYAFLTVLNALARTVLYFLAGKVTVLHICVFCIGITHTGLFILPPIYLMETTNFGFRTKIALWSCATWAFGYMGLAFIALFNYRWWILCLGNNVMSYLVCTFFLGWVESPRWLFTHGNIGSCARQIKQILWENVNQERVTQGLIVDLLRDMRSRLYGANPATTGALPKFIFYKLFTKYHITKITILSCLTWFCSGCLHQISLLNLDKMYENRFCNLMSVTGMCIPSIFMGGYIAKTTTRRRSLVVFFAACAGFSILGILNFEINETRNMLCLLILIFNVVAVVVMVIQTVEMFPTECRATGCGISAMFWLITITLVPSYDELAVKQSAIPYVTTLVLAVIAAFASSILPETFEATLPDTIDQLQWRRYNCFWGSSCRRRPVFIQDDNDNENRGVNNPCYLNDDGEEEDDSV